MDSEMEWEEEINKYGNWRSSEERMQELVKDSERLVEIKRERLEHAMRLFWPDGTPKPQRLWEMLVAEFSSIEPERELVIECLRELLKATLKGDELPQHREE